MNLVFTNEWREKFDRAINEFITAHNLRADSLTQEQLAEAFRQAIACGDFVRNVCALDDSQQVVYQPYREVEMLRADNRRLREALTVIRDGVGLTEDDVSRGISRYEKAAQIADAALAGETTDA